MDISISLLDVWTKPTLHLSEITNSMLQSQKKSVEVSTGATTWFLLQLRGCAWRRRAAGRSEVYVDHVFVLCWRERVQSWKGSSDLAEQRLQDSSFHFSDVWSAMDINRELLLVKVKGGNINKESGPWRWTQLLHWSLWTWHHAPVLWLLLRQWTLSWWHHIQGTKIRIVGHFIEKLYRKSNSLDFVLSRRWGVGDGTRNWCYNY